MFTHTTEGGLCKFCLTNNMLLLQKKLIKARLVHVPKLVFPPSITGVTTVLQHGNSGVQGAEQNPKYP